MNRPFRRLITTLVVFACLHLAPLASACATCFGKSDSKLAEGMNWGILTLLFIIMSVLGGISAFFVFVARRSATLHSNVR